MLQGKDIEFIYKGHTFIWTGDSFLNLKSDTEEKHKKPITDGNQITNILNSIINEIP